MDVNIFTVNNFLFLATGTLLGVVITNVINLIRDHFTRSAEKERHIRELAVNAAIEQWKEERASAAAFNVANPTAPKQTVKPLRLRIVSFLNFSEVLCAKKITAETISGNYVDSNAIIKSAEKLIAAEKAKE